MQEIMAVAIVATIAFTIYRLFELFARRKERLMMIEKLSSGIDPQLLASQMNLPLCGKENNSSNGSWALRIGALLVGVGLGVVTAAAVDLLVESPSIASGDVYYNFRNTISALYPACADVFGGLGLVIAYIIEKKNDKKGA